MKKNFWLLILLASILAVSGCSIYGNNQSSAPRTAPAGTQPATSNDNLSAAINIENFSFNPSSITVKKGATVTWTNKDSAPHQIKSASFNSAIMNQGQSFSFTFNDTGTFNYSCAIHPSMTGEIIVQ